MERQADYLFEMPGRSWHATARMFAGSGRFDVVAVDESGRGLPRTNVLLPEGFLAAHPCRRLIGASLKFERSMERSRVRHRSGGGRPSRAERAVRPQPRAADCTHRVPTITSCGGCARTRRRSSAAASRASCTTASRSRCSASRWRSSSSGAARPRKGRQLAADLARVHRIVRDEVVSVRELMEGIRVGDVESEDILHHLGKVVDRFSRHTGSPRASCRTDTTPRCRHTFAANGGNHSRSARQRAQAQRSRPGHRSHGRSTASWWRLSIEDDGRGFEFAGRRTLDRSDSSARVHARSGERVRLIGGALAVESRPGFGARIEVAVPVTVKAA